MSKRIPHLDNLRSGLVLAVVVLHAALAYNQWAGWWYAADPAWVPGFDLLTLILDTFPLPVLFFLAGYFAPLSKDARGPHRFVTSKLKRLGIPLLVVAVALIPIVPWIAISSRGLPVEPLASFWFRYLGQALVPEAMLAQGLPDYTQFGLHFSQFHLWFISLLLCFFLLYALIPQGKQKAGRKPGRPLWGLAGLLVGGLLIALAMAGVATTMQEWSWLNLSWLLFQPVRLPLYLGFFVLGVLAYRRGWLRNGVLPGPLWAWLVATAAMVVLFVAISPRLMQTAAPLAFPLALGQQALRVFLCLAWLGLLLRLFQRLASGNGKTAASLAACSYDIYLLHLPLCVVAQLLLRDTALPGLLKFTLVLCGTTLVCWGLSMAWRRAARRRYAPR